MAVRIEFKIEPGSLGSANFAIRAGDQCVAGKPGYMRDSLGDLARLALCWCEGRKPTWYVSFAVEPGSYLCRFRGADQKVQVECREVDGMFNDHFLFEEDAKNNPPLFVGEEDPIQLAMNVCELLDHAWRECGIVGYKQTWHAHGVPLAELLLLRLWLDRNPLVAAIADHAAKREQCYELEFALLQAPLDLCRDGAGVEARRAFKRKQQM